MCHPKGVLSFSLGEGAENGAATHKHSEQVAKKGIMMRSTRLMFGSVRFGKYSRHLAVISVALALLASSRATGVAKLAKGGSANAHHIQSKIRDMTLEEKVGQMFMLQV